MRGNTKSYRPIKGQPSGNSPRRRADRVKNGKKKWEDRRGEGQVGVATYDITGKGLGNRAKKQIARARHNSREKKTRKGERTKSI